MTAYADKILAAALAAGMKSADAATLSYPQLAVLAGVVLGKNGEAPEDFFGESQRAMLAAALQEKERGIVTAELRSALDAAMADVYVRYPGLSPKVKVLVEEAAGIVEPKKVEPVAEKP